jgi:hypothetical protein
MIHVRAPVSGQEDWEQQFDLLDEHAFVNAVTDLAKTPNATVGEIEGLLAPKVGQQRKRWAKLNGERPSSQARGSSQERTFLDGVITSADFAAASFQRDWLVRGMLVRDEPIILGGPKKSLKTSFTVDLAISLGSATPFLGKWTVRERVTVLVLSGESGLATLQETARRVCQARDISLADCHVLWYDRLPRLGSPQDLDVLSEFISRQSVGVVIIDPLYLCLLHAGLNLSAANLFDVGPLLLAVSRVCRDAGATPILVHHARKQALLLFAETKCDCVSRRVISFSSAGPGAGHRAPHQPVGSFCQKTGSIPSSHCVLMTQQMLWQRNLHRTSFVMAVALLERT